MSIGSFSAASIDSSDDTGSIESMLFDPIATLQEGLVEMEVFGREMNNYTYK
jgi:hypothetical protein